MEQEIRLIDWAHIDLSQAKDGTTILNGVYASGGIFYATHQNNRFQPKAFKTERGALAYYFKIHPHCKP